MYIIAGLGNPKPEYRNTRHNIGFDVIDVLADKYNIDVTTIKHKALTGKGIIEGNKCILVKPQTYMNLSGESLIDVCQYYKIDVETELIVIYDDIALDVGAIRVRKKGSAGGHNGMKSIIQNLSTENFMRIRMGVGEKPKGYDLADYVLGHFTNQERDLMDKASITATEAIKVIMSDGIDKAMGAYNKKNECTDNSTDRA
ncbi:MAG: aminoacyl-tRNA hydrolase [Lachnospiraceae bacterium]|nr:aminoacyl-tRNA hydrolase [Lachnospiraceae bacterium]